MNYAERIRTATDEDLADLLMAFGAFGHVDMAVRRAQILRILHTQWPETVEDFKAFVEGNEHAKP